MIEGGLWFLSHPHLGETRVDIPGKGKHLVAFESKEEAEAGLRWGILHGHNVEHEFPAFMDFATIGEAFVRKIDDTIGIVVVQGSKDMKILRTYTDREIAAAFRAFCGLADSPLSTTKAANA